MIVAPFRPTTLAKNAQTLVSRVNSRTCDSFIGPRKALENPKYLTKTYFYQPFAAREHRQIGSWFCETESCEGNNLSGIGPHFPQDSRPLRFKKRSIQTESQDGSVLKPRPKSRRAFLLQMGGLAGPQTGCSEQNCLLKARKRR